MAEYSPACAPRAPYYPLSPSCNPFQRGGLGGFRARFESEMGCFQISLRQLCPLPLMQRGIKIDMKIIGWEMAPPPWGGPTLPPASAPLHVGVSPSTGAARLCPPGCLQPRGHKSLPILLTPGPQFLSPSHTPSPNIFLTWDGGRHHRRSSSHHPFPCFQPNPIPQTHLGLNASPARDPCLHFMGGFPALQSHRPLGRAGTWTWRVRRS